MINKTINFLRLMFSDSNCVSSSRIAFYIIMTWVLFMSTIHWNTLTPDQTLFLKEIFWTGAGLMGVRYIKDAYSSKFSNIVGGTCDTGNNQERVD